MLILKKNLIGDRPVPPHLPPGLPVLQIGISQRRVIPDDQGIFGVTVRRSAGIVERPRFHVSAVSDDHLVVHDFKLADGSYRNTGIGQQIHRRHTCTPFRAVGFPVKYHSDIDTPLFRLDQCSRYFR